MGNAAADAAKTGTFLAEKYRRIARRRGSERAIAALGRSILVIAWHLLSDPDARFYDLGPGYHAARIDPERRKRSHVRQLEALGYKVPWNPQNNQRLTRTRLRSTLSRMLPHAR